MLKSVRRLLKNSPLFLSALGLIAVFVFGLYSLQEQEKEALNTQQLAIYIKEGNEKCFRKEDFRERNKCLDGLAEKLIQKSEFEALLNGFEESGIDCHNLMHAVSRKEVKRTGNFAEVTRKCTPVCFNACYHGSTVGFLKNKGLEGASLSKIYSEARSACNSFKEISPFRSQCVHGLGHAFMTVTGMELFDSLELCDRLDANMNDPHICSEGVFMENFPLSTTTPHPPKYIKESDPAYPCNVVENKYKPKCYIFLTSYLYYLNNQNWARTAQACGAIPEEYRNMCYKTVGSSGAAQFSLEEKEKACDPVPAAKGGREACLEGVVEFFFDRYGGTNKIFDVFGFCKTLNAADEKETCYNKAIKRAEAWVMVENKKEYICSKIKEKDMAKTCKD